MSRARSSRFSWSAAGPPDVSRAFSRSGSAEIVLAPIELTGILTNKYFLALLGLWIIGLLGVRFLAFDMPAILGAIVAGTILVPALLPWIPGRAFAVKGALLGLDLGRRGLPVPRRAVRLGRELGVGPFLCPRPARPVRLPGHEFHRFEHDHLALRRGPRDAGRPSPDHRRRRSRGGGDDRGRFPAEDLRGALRCRCATWKTWSR